MTRREFLKRIGMPLLDFYTFNQIHLATEFDLGLFFLQSPGVPMPANVPAEHMYPALKRVVYLWPYILITISLLGLAIQAYRRTF